MTKPTIEEIEPLAREFAKTLLIQKNKSKLTDVFDEAMALAIEWLELRIRIQQKLDNDYPNWIDVKKESFDVQWDKPYWVIGAPHLRVHSQPPQLEMFIARCSGIDDNKNPATLTFENPNAFENPAYEIFYLLDHEESRKYIGKDKPKPPLGISLKKTDPYNNI